MFYRLHTKQLFLALCVTILLAYLMVLKFNLFETQAIISSSRGPGVRWMEMLNRWTNFANTSLEHEVKTSTEFVLPSSTLSFSSQEKNTRNPFMISPTQIVADPGYHGIDLMAMPPYDFDPAYKNPCWKDGGVLHCLPYFYLIGVKKSGTTDLWHQICNQKDIVQPRARDASFWFAKGRFVEGKGDFQEYINQFATAALKIERQFRVDESSGQRVYPLVTGDGCPDNLFRNSHWRYLPGNEHLDEPRYVILDYIQHFLPKAKLIIVFRDPVERLYSDYYTKQNRETIQNATSPQHFHEEVVYGLQLYQTCLLTRSLRSCLYDEEIYGKIGMNIQLGIYHVYWKELLRLFPRDQLLIIHNKDLGNKELIGNKLFKFLNLSTFSSTFNQKQTHHTRKIEDAKKGDMLNETRKLLEEFYRPHNEEMYKLTEDVTFLYQPKFA